MAVAATARIHPSAIVEDGATIGENAEVGSFSIIGPACTLGDGVTVRSHAVVTGATRIGAGCTIFPGAVVGEIPQDKKFAGEDTRLEIGPETTIREHVTINTGTAGGGGVTRVGARCLLMAGCHIAHDVHLGDNVIVVNNAGIAGHVVIGDDAIIGGLSGIHQFVRIGRGAIVGAVTMVTNDVIPYGLVQGPRGVLDGLNLVGLKRRGVARGDITALRAAYQMLAQGEGAFAERAARLSDDHASAEVREIVEFILAGSDRQFLTPK